MRQPPGRLEYWAERKAQYATFPGAAFDTSPLGPYAKKYAKELVALAEVRDARSKVQKTSRNFIARVAYDAVQIERLLYSVATPASGGPWGDWGEAFKKCCTVLPDLEYCGYVGLSEEAFQNKFRGNALLLLHHMFEKHNGEIVVVWKADRGLYDLADAWPSVRQEIHRPQYYTLNTKEVDVKRNLANRYFTRKNKTISDAKRFCCQMKDVASSVYNPVTSSVTLYDDDLPTKVQKIEVGYFSLPSLVWELFPWITLAELYTFYCTRPLLTARRPHPRTTNVPRKAAAWLRKVETGYWGFGRG